MKSGSLVANVILLLSLIPVFVVAQNSSVNPYVSSQWAPPPGYNGPMFKLSYNYPRQPPMAPTNPPWLRVLQGKPLSADNSLAYLEAVKNAVAPDMKKLFFDYGHWDAAQAQWYNLPWLFSIRDPLHGTYQGINQDPDMFTLSHMKQNNMTTHMIVYYNELAGYTLRQVWGDDAKNPDVKKCQFLDGAIIIKAAFTTALAKDWSPMEGALEWEVFPPRIDSDGNPQAPARVMKVAFFQFDIIVKDTKAAPKTGWVFGTLVYDKHQTGDGWDKMVPLGVMWGNDPDINSAETPNTILQENVINPMAPLYAVETLGYGGRLSGPNDGAVSQGNVVDGRLAPRVRSSSCMGCHGTAEWPLKSSLTPMFLPRVGEGSDPSYAGLTVMPRPGSPEFNRWFQDRPGTQPQDEGTTALDYDMNIAIKALPLWQKWYNSTHPMRPDQQDFVSRLPKEVRQMVEKPESTSQNGRRLRPSH